MKKIFSKFSFLVLAFGLLWFALFQFNWVELFQVERNKDRLEAKLGKLYWEVLSATESTTKSEDMITPVDSILTQLCIPNQLNQDHIKLHIIKKEVLNAVTLPDGHLVIYTGLINECKSPDELAAVIAHELAHMELNHIMQKLIKEIGLGVLVTMAGGSGGEMVSESLNVLLSKSFDRDLEREADQKAIDFLHTANIESDGFADFMYRMSEKESSYLEAFEWFSTHPNSKDRALNIVEYSNKQQRIEHPNPLLSDSSWTALKIATSKLD